MQRERLLIGVAFAVIYLVWGSTYLFNYFAIQSIPPFLMCGSRFIVAGMLLFVIKPSLLQEPLPPLRKTLNAMLIGVLFLSVGVGGVVWAEQWIESSMAALLIAFDPLLIMLLMWMLIGSRPGGRSIVGGAIGVLGMALLVGQPHLTQHREAIFGLLAIFGSMLAWGIGSIFLPRLDLPKSRIQSTALQMLGGGVVLLVFSALMGEMGAFDPRSISLRSGLSWLYLIAFGSILAFSAFNFLLSRVSPEKVATSTFVNPIVALLLGWWLNGETVTGQSILAGVVLLTGVFFIQSHKNTTKPFVEPSES